MQLHQVLVFLAGYIIYGLSIGHFYSMGALFPVIMETFNSTRAETSIIQSIYAGILLGGGILYGGLTSRFGPVKANIVGSLATSLGLIASFWTTSFLFLIATSAITAFGEGLIFVTCTVGVRQHFTGQAAVVALALISSSSGTMGTALTYLLRYLSERFGLRGTLLIIGGLQLNNVVLSVLLTKPLTRDNPNTRGTVIKSEKSTNSANSENNLQCATEHINQGMSNELPVVSTTNNDNTSVMVKHSDGYVNKGYTSTSGIKENMDIMNNTVSDSEGLDTNTCYHTNTNIASDESIQVFNSCNNDTNDANKLCLKSKFKYILRIPSYVCILMGMSMCISTTLMYSVFILDMFVDKGFSNSEGAVGLVIINIMAIVGRASPAAFAHCKFYDPFIMPVTATLLSSIAMVLFAVVNDLSVCFIASGFIGFGLGVTVSVIVVNVSEVVEQQYLAEAIGLLMTGNGVFALITGPLTGFIRDITGSYSIPQSLAAIFTGIGSVMFALALICNRRQAKDKNRRQSIVFHVTKL